jgi:hypothetical protein
VGEAEAMFACDLHARTERETLFALAAIARVTPEVGLIVDGYR